MEVLRAGVLRIVFEFIFVEALLKSILPHEKVLMYGVICDS